jgi:predicted ABC-type ATPase
VSPTKRLRIFAGPNGSGKSTLVQLVKDLNIKLGVYINADDIKVEIQKTGMLDFSQFSIIFDLDHLKDYYSKSSFYEKSGMSAKGLNKVDNSLSFSENIVIDDYFVSFLADYIRNFLLGFCDKFTFETVMSHPSKLDFIRMAKEKNYRIYLYYIALEDPDLNVRRVETRVSMKGHDVPSNKIVERYPKSMDMLIDAILLVDKSFIFDNSGEKPIMLANSDKDEISVLEEGDVPYWFKEYVLDKLG